MHNEPIRLFPLGAAHSMRRHAEATHYANVQGVHKRMSIGVYFDSRGAVVSCTLYDGKDAQALLSKLHSEIARRGLSFEAVEEVQ
jgi:hypothetical protein